MTRFGGHRDVQPTGSTPVRAVPEDVRARRQTNVRAVPEDVRARRQTNVRAVPEDVRARRQTNVRAVPEDARVAWRELLRLSPLVARVVGSCPMTSLSERFAAWMAEHDTENPATPAATVLALRDSDNGPEILMVQRNAKGTFASNWVFPGGKVDPEDFLEGDDIVDASRRAASREALEEADLVVDQSQLVPFSHWMPPTVVPRRFATWFYATEAPRGVDGDVTIDGGEIVDHLWVTPDEALAKHAAGEVMLVPPTWITLKHLAPFTNTHDALVAITDREPPFYLTKMVQTEPPTVMWHGDVGYDSGDLDLSGPRHRLSMAPGGWTFEEPTGWPS